MAVHPVIHIHLIPSLFLSTVWLDTAQSASTGFPGWACSGIPPVSASSGPFDSIPNDTGDADSTAGSGRVRSVVRGMNHCRRHRQGAFPRPQYTTRPHTACRLIVPIDGRRRRPASNSGVTVSPLRFVGGTSILPLLLSSPLPCLFRL